MCVVRDAAGVASQPEFQNSEGAVNVRPSTAIDPLTVIRRQTVCMCACLCVYISARGVCVCVCECVCGAPGCDCASPLVRCDACVQATRLSDVRAAIAHQKRVAVAAELCLPPPSHKAAPAPHLITGTPRLLLPSECVHCDKCVGVCVQTWTSQRRSFRATTSARSAVRSPSCLYFCALPSRVPPGVVAVARSIDVVFHCVCVC